MGDTLIIAAVQMEPKILNKKNNLARCRALMEVTAEEGAGLIVFPECALTGYCFDSLNEAVPLAERMPCPSTEEILAGCL